MKFVIDLPPGATVTGGKLCLETDSAALSLCGSLGRMLRGEITAGGRPKEPPHRRCPCGKFTKWTAAKRGHVCEKPC